MNFLTFQDGTKVAISREIYCTYAPTVHSKGVALWRLIGGIYGDDPTPGWHPYYNEGWRSVINLDKCYHGVPRKSFQDGYNKSVYCGIHIRFLKRLETNPLNEAMP